MSVPAPVLGAVDNPTMIFDVGANQGRTVMDAHRAYPKARIIAFEPVSATFDMLIARVGTLPCVETHKMALSDQAGSALMRAVPGGLYNKLLKDGDARPEMTETVQISTGDLFCEQHGIAHIDFMKIDAEGNDLKVLHGFRSMIARRSVKYIQIETGINPENKLHVPLTDLMEFFADYKYGLISLYEPVHRNPHRKMVQRGMYFCNSLFAAEEYTDREKRLMDRDARRERKGFVRAGSTERLLDFAKSMRSRLFFRSEPN